MTELMKNGPGLTAWKNEQWDQGQIVINTYTIYSKEPIYTATPAEEFGETLKVVDLDPERFVEQAEPSIREEGLDFHDDLTVLFAQRLKNLEFAQALADRVGVIDQYIVVDPDNPERGKLPPDLEALIHPDISTEVQRADH